MPIADPQVGRVFVWLISCFILLCLATGGAFLVVYMTQPPDSTSSSWLLYAGMGLVGLPWFFWLILCLYRCISRSLGFRIVCGGGGTGGPDEAGNGVPSTVNRSGSVVGGPANSGPGNVQNANGNASNKDISCRSHESEIPLASAMAN